MTDIVKQLREMSNDLLRPYESLTREAANEIERLRALTNQADSANAAQPMGRCAPACAWVPTHG